MSEEEDYLRIIEQVRRESGRVGRDLGNLRAIALCVSIISVGFAVFVLISLIR